MQISALNVSANSAAANMATSNNVSNVPPSAYAQTGSYSHPVSFNQSQLAQSASPNPGIASSASFPTSHMQPHQGMHPQSHLQGTYTTTGAIANSILPGSVVDDPQAAANAQFAPAPQQQDTLQNSYAWSDQHQALAPQQHNPNGRQQPPPPQPPQRYSYLPQQLRGQQNGMLPLPMVGGVRGAVSGALTSAGLPPGLSGLSSGGMLTHIGGTMAGMGSLPQGNSNLMPIGMQQPTGYPETDGAAGGRAFTPQLDMMGAPLRGSSKAAAAALRSPYDTSPFGAHGIGSLPPAGGGGLGDLPDPGAGAPYGGPSPPGAGMKHEESSGPFMRPMKPPRARMPRSRRKSQPPGTPCVPVHLRNPKKGRDRVFRKCQHCNHDNHIRRSNCDSCKQPLPAGKRRRDGSLSFSSASKKAEALKAEAALKAEQLKNDTSHLRGVPVSSAPPPIVAPLVGIPQSNPSPMEMSAPPPSVGNGGPPIVRQMPTADGHRAN